MKNNSVKTIEKVCKPNKDSDQPINNFSAILNEKWALIILHLLMIGRKRFNQFVDDLNFISPSIISKRLNFLESQLLIVKTNKLNGCGYEYHLTKKGVKLKPSVLFLDNWGENLS